MRRKLPSMLVHKVLHHTHAQRTCMQLMSGATDSGTEQRIGSTRLRRFCAITHTYTEHKFAPRVVLLPVLCVRSWRRQQRCGRLTRRRCALGQQIYMRMQSVCGCTRCVCVGAVCMCLYACAPQNLTHTCTHKKGSQLAGAGVPMAVWGADGGPMGMEMAGNTGCLCVLSDAVRSSSLLHSGKV